LIIAKIDKNFHLFTKSEVLLSRSYQPVTAFYSETKDPGHTLSHSVL